MLNRLATAIAAFNTANTAIPVAAEDEAMDKAVRAAGDALERIIRIPALKRDEALAKLSFAATLLEWDTCRDQLIQRAQTELLAALHREQAA